MPAALNSPSAQSVAPRPHPAKSFRSHVPALAAVPMGRERRQYQPAEVAEAVLQLLRNVDRY